MKTQVYLSLGSNLGDRAGNLLQAIKLLAGAGEVVLVSSIYETAPVEVTYQSWFLNCALHLDTQATPDKLLANLLAIEKSMGRERTCHKGPRLIDLDILIFGDHPYTSPTLTVPHPAMHQRRFVLAPMVEIAPDLRHPLSQRSMRQLLEDLPPDGQEVRRVP